MASQFTERVNVLFTPKQFVQLQAWARDEDRPLPNLIRRLCDVALSQRADPTDSYARVAEKCLRVAGRPMSTTELLDAMTAAGRPVNGITRKHRLSTLTTSLNRSRSVMRGPTGWSLCTQHGA